MRFASQLPVSDEAENPKEGVDKRANSEIEVRSFYPKVTENRAMNPTIALNPIAPTIRSRVDYSPL